MVRLCRAGSGAPGTVARSNDEHAQAKFSESGVFLVSFLPLVDSRVQLGSDGLQRSPRIDMSLGLPSAPLQQPLIPASVLSPCTTA
ncbi:hypothetical protein CBM2626_U20008 [Cupriavidus taiwanensis]|uniref:Uncharacterized protein n=1 Tax=Cupriavidus taiwanensis TaxID=164546 RepID=A0A375EHH4_9BURK|nr:hypothetical protein CBM2614_U10078 [Cupriavidus taiwanensis]SOZ73384.1 hypothetical protein CBM2615_U10071 [Cupriavidus taiwanensis]SOZ75144.1 hypothetical protein CBM2613_U10046 [Cupriavidus taiwanensis]SPA03792.1 hypothetical protein CBM2626_U20008 [Cupriavidus taiwanensis]SPD48662.1 protein of unknown function [Cupriavidus taiwanensis]